MLYFTSVARDDDSLLGRAERTARRALERLGEAVERTLPASGPSLRGAFDSDQAIRLIEEAIESNLRYDDSCECYVAPNRLKVLLTYEERGQLGDRQMEELTRELEAAARDFIADRRYGVSDPVKVEIGCDFLAKSTAVKIGFEAAPAGATTGTQTFRIIELHDSRGGTYRLELVPNGSPAYIGRAAGNAVHLDHPSVSRFHCSLSLGPQDEILVADLGSSNGTWVNDEIVSTGEVRTVEPGDEIGVGDVKLCLSLVLG